MASSRFKNDRDGFQSTWGNQRAYNPSGRFGGYEAGSLGENALVLIAATWMERGFEAALGDAVNGSPDVFRISTFSVLWLIIKFISLLIRDQQGQTKTRRFFIRTWERMTSVFRNRK